MAFSKGNTPWNKNKKGVQQPKKGKESPNWKEDKVQYKNCSRCGKQLKTFYSKTGLCYRCFQETINIPRLKEHPNFKGKKHPHEYRVRMSLLKGGNGLTRKVGYPFEFDYAYKTVIRKRDKYCCKMCGVKQGKHKHDVHHIDYNKNNLIPENLITLCKSCHAKTNPLKVREFYQEYLPTLIN